MSTISEFYDDPRNRPGVVDLCQKLGMLPEMLAEQPFHLDLHVLAAQRGHLRLNDWLLEQRNGPNKDALVQVSTCCILMLQCVAKVLDKFSVDNAISLRAPLHMTEIWS